MMAMIEPSSFGAISAVLHAAPAPGAVAGFVEKDPIAPIFRRGFTNADSLQLFFRGDYLGR